MKSLMFSANLGIRQGRDVTWNTIALTERELYVNENYRMNTTNKMQVRTSFVECF